MARTRNEARFEEQRLAILDAAGACFARAGFQGAGIADICAEANVSAGRLYHYFPSKQAIIEAIVAEDRATAAALLDRLHDAADLASFLEVVGSALRMVATADYGRLALEVVAEAARNEPVRRAMLEAAAEAQFRLVAAIRKGQRDGWIGTVQTAEAAARVILIVIDGATGREALEPHMPVEALVHILCAMLGRLLAPAGGAGR